MAISVDKLGVQSWCFRAFKDVDALIAQVLAIGLKRIELCGVHADLSNPAAFEAVAEKFKTAGVAISSIGVQYFDGDLAKEENWFKVARRAGASMISTSLQIAKFPAHFADMATLADKYDINLGIHNHGGYDWLGNQNMLDYIFKSHSPRIGLCLDTAWCLQAGEDPLKSVEKFSDRLYGVHIKDFIFNRAGKPEDVVVGTGNLKLTEFLCLSPRPRIAKRSRWSTRGTSRTPGRS